MTSTLTKLTPQRVAELLQHKEAVLIDIREADEFARLHVAGALSRPLSAFESAHVGIKPGQDVVFTCKTGMRTNANCARLAAAVEGQAFVLEGGLDGWTSAGLPTAENRKAPLEMMRQVQIGAGALVLASVTLGIALHPAFLALAMFVGAGQAVAGVTGWCGMAKVLARAPWNLPAKA
jgi:rhodanese-related sulfurtransferase